LSQFSHDLVAVLDQQLKGKLKTFEHLPREVRIVSSAFLFRDPATLAGYASLTFGYMPVSRLQVREVVRHCEP